MTVVNQELKSMQSRSWWGCSLWAVSSGSTLFAKVSVLVYMAERFKWAGAQHFLQFSMCAQTRISLRNHMVWSGSLHVIQSVFRRTGKTLIISYKITCEPSEDSDSGSEQIISYKITSAPSEDSDRGSGQIISYMVTCAPSEDSDRGFEQIISYNITWRSAKIQIADLSRSFPTRWHVRPAKTQIAGLSRTFPIRLHVCPVKT